MRRGILGTAGHIDHGKTALVRALTGVDTDRLREERERGITIDLGFAPLELPGGRRVGVVDVPGHEGFVRNMVAGATGTDVVLLVVAADEGVMPQTREHLAIVELLGVERLVVALTKADLVEEAWLPLVEEEVAEALAGGPFEGAPQVPTSAPEGRGLDALLEALAEAFGPDEAAEEDLVRLPLDRAFTVPGVGTVVTGTLWSGTLREGDRVRALPSGIGARVRGVQVHGGEVPEARAGERTALSLVGPDVFPGALPRGETLVADPGWPATSMLTVRLRVLETPGWSVEDGQRVRVHLGTAEVMARAAVLEGGTLPAGGEGWVQLRLERPVVARAGDRLVVRSYSPVTTIAGGRVAEPLPERRTRLEAGEVEALRRILEGDAREAVEAALSLRGWRGWPGGLLPVVTGATPGAIRSGWEEGGASPEGVPGTGAEEMRVSRRIREEARRILADAVASWHEREPLRPGIPLEDLRTTLPDRAPPSLAEEVLDRLREEGALVVDENVASLPSFRVRLDGAQRARLDRIREIYREAALAPPPVEDLPEDVGRDGDIWPLLRILEREGELVTLEEGLLAWAPAVLDAARRAREVLGGREGLGPSDFREVLGVSRRHMLPLLGHFDRTGVTRRRGDLRSVPGGSVGGG